MSSTTHIDPCHIPFSSQQHELASIPTWQQRAADAGYYPNSYGLYDGAAMNRCMSAEIADLRAALSSSERQDAQGQKDEACAHCQRLPGDPAGYCDWAACPVGPAVPAPAEPALTATDLSKRLRNIASENTSPYFCTNVPKDDLRAAADEIERYYSGMLAWKQTAEKKDRDWNEERMGRVNDRIAARAAPSVPTGGSIDTPEFLDLLAAWGSAPRGGEAIRAANNLIAYIDTYVASKVQAARDEASQWISVDERLPKKYCLAAYETRRGTYQIIRAMYVRQYEIEATGDECDSETNDADDMEYIKAGWYELIDNWGDYSSVKVNEGEVKFWRDLPRSPAATDERQDNG